nr:LamG-like jellyroll fold domain-containing protein [Ruegeria arenilitoris]
MSSSLSLQGGIRALLAASQLVGDSPPSRKRKHRSCTTCVNEFNTWYYPLTLTGTTSAMSTFTVSNDAQLSSALKSAKGGDTIILADGNYSGLEITNDYSSMVTIQAANPGKANFNGSIQLDGASNITFDGITTKGLRADNYSSDIGVINSTSTSGLYFRDVSNLTVANNDISGGTNALTLNDVQYFTVSNNDIHGAASDLMRITGDSHHGLIEDNYLHDIAADRPLHPDMIQVFGYDGAMPHDLRFTGNHLYDDPATGSVYAQGIFLSGPIGEGYKNIQVDNNIINVGSPNSIYISGGQENVVIENNTLIPWPGEGGAIIRIADRDGYSNEGVTVRDNVAKQLLDETGQSTIENNNYFYKGTDGSVLFQGDGEDWQDFIPKSSSSPFALGNGLGADARLLELLSGTSGSGDNSTSTPAPTPAPEEPAEEVQPAPEVPEVTPEEPSQPADSNDDAALNPNGKAVLSLAGAHEISSSGDVIEIAPDSALNVDAATIALTFNADTVSGKRGILTKDAYGYTGGGDHFVAYIEKGTLKLRFQDGGEDAFITVNGIKANTDYDLQVSFGNGDATVWLNGQKVGQVDTEMDWSGNNEYLQVGALGWASDTGEAGFNNVFDGTISDVVIVENEYDPAGLAAALQAEPETPAESETPAENETPTEPETPVENETPTEPASGTVFALTGDNEFNGSKSDAINLAHESGLAIDEGTIAFTFEADKVNGKQGLVSKDASGYEGGGDHFTAYIHNGKLKVRFQDGEDDALFVFRNVKANTEYDVQAYFDGENVGVLVNGELIGQQANSMDWSTNEEYLQVGGMGWGSDTGDDEVNYGFDGTLTDVTIFDTAIQQPLDIA